jgi:hypothetical protein
VGEAFGDDPRVLAAEADPVGGRMRIGRPDGGSAGDLGARLVADGDGVDVAVAADGAVAEQALVFVEREQLEGAALAAELAAAHLGGGLVAASGEGAGEQGGAQRVGRGFAWGHHRRRYTTAAWPANTGQGAQPS